MKSRGSDRPENNRFLDVCIAKMRFTPNLVLIVQLSRQQINVHIVFLTLSFWNWCQLQLIPVLEPFNYMSKIARMLFCHLTIASLSSYCNSVARQTLRASPDFRPYQVIPAHVSVVRQKVKTCAYPVNQPVPPPSATVTAPACPVSTQLARPQPAGIQGSGLILVFF